MKKVRNGSGLCVAHVITGLDTGGAETALCRLLESLRSPKFEHIVVALGGEGALSGRARAAGAEVVHLSMNPARPGPGALVALRRVLHAASPHLLHGWMYHANLAATLASLGSGIPLIWGIRQSLYELQQEKNLTRMVIWAGARFSKLPRRILYNSVTSARQHEASGYEAARSEVIPNGFDLAEFKPDQDRRSKIRRELRLASYSFVIGLIARLHPMKDHDCFLRAAAEFVRSRPDAMFVLVGEGVDADNRALVEQARELGLTEHIRFCGRRSDIAAINAALDVASSSSRGEAFPNAIGEAMACGVPVVATDVGDVREIVGDAGIIVPRRDHHSLCAGWAKLADMSLSTRESIGRYGRARIAERYALPAISKQYAELYQQLSRSKACAA